MVRHKMPQVKKRDFVTFLSDYGLEDEFVGICHAAMLRIAPHLRIIDVHHNILRQDIRHGAVVLLLVYGGAAGEAPIAGARNPADPLPQALALTAIVISFGLSAFLLVLAYRSWLIRGTDEVEDDVEDRRIARLDRRDDRP